MSEDGYQHAREVAARLQDKLGVGVYAQDNGRWLEVNVFDIERKLADQAEQQRALNRLSANNHRKSYMKAYQRLTNVLTNMHASERRALDESPVYVPALECVIAGRDQEAVDLVLTLRDERGDRWRASAADCGLIATSNFVNEV